MMRSVRVTVPATTANLGPGFDSLGLAVNLRNEVVMQAPAGFRSSGEPSVCLAVEGRGEGVLPTNRQNLVVKVADRVFASARKVPERLNVRLINRIPLARGLGSSAAATVGGLLAANELCDRPLSQEQLLNLAAEIEGHPDNIAPALLGGLTISMLGEDGRINVVQPRVRNDLICLFCVPDRPMPTAQARRVLPKSYPRADVVFSISRAAVLTALLQGGSLDMLKLAMQDRLHQPYRARLMPGMMECIRAAENAGAAGACLSGSGPAVLALVGPTGNTEQIGRAMSAAFSAVGVRSEILVLNVSRTGARVTRT